MTTIEDVTAGTYELVVARWDERTSEPGKPLTYKRHRKGEHVELDEATAKRLWSAGAITEPGAADRAQAALLKAQLQQVLARLPEDQRALLAEGIDLDGAAPADGQGPAVPDEAKGSSTPERPSKAADKGAWVQYIVDLGLKSAEDAGKLTRDQLIELAPSE